MQWSRDSNRNINKIKMEFLSFTVISFTDYYWINNNLSVFKLINIFGLSQWYSKDRVYSIGLSVITGSALQHFVINKKIKNKQRKKNASYLSLFSMSWQWHSLNSTRDNGGTFALCCFYFCTWRALFSELSSVFCIFLAPHCHCTTANVSCHLWAIQSHISSSIIWLHS